MTESIAERVAALERWQETHEAAHQRVDTAPDAALTPQLRQVLRLTVVDGLTITGIAERLGLSAKTIEAHMAKLRLVTRSGNREQLFRWANINRDQWEMTTGP